MLRTSSYTIYVDLPDSSSEMLLVHGYTGAYDKVSRRVANYLRTRDSRRPPKPLYGEWSPEPEVAQDTEPPPKEAIEALKKRGYLTASSPEDEEEFFARFAKGLHQRHSQRAPSYIFMPTYDCNLRCSYCFQDHMRTDDSFRHLLRTMTPQLIDRIFQSTAQLEAAHGLEPSPERRRSIGFFGGEPLMAESRAIVEHIMDQARALGPAEFWAVTNGTDLEAYDDLLGRDGISRLQITLDGPPREHDRRRIYADASPSYERIARNIDRALGRDTVVNVRLNIDRGNLQDLPELTRDLRSRGWHKHRDFSVYTAPINAVNDNTDHSRTLNSWQLDQALTEMREEHPDTWIIGRPDEAIRVRARQIFDGHEGLVPQLRPSFCGAHDQMYIFDPFGDIYACWERTGEPKVRIARITEDGGIEFQHAVNTQWRSRSVASNPVCRRCRYALHCGGGCAILALGQRGKFHANYCDGFASRFRSSVADAYRAFAAGEEATHLHDRVCDL